MIAIWAWKIWNFVKTVRGAAILISLAFGAYKGYGAIRDYFKADIIKDIERKEAKQIAKKTSTAKVMRKRDKKILDNIPKKEEKPQQEHINDLVDRMKDLGSDTGGSLWK